jgi:hypothetical protein
VCSWQVVGGFSSGDDNVDPFDSWWKVRWRSFFYEQCMLSLVSWP